MHDPAAYCRWAKRTQAELGVRLRSMTLMAAERRATASLEKRVAGLLAAAEERRTRELVEYVKNYSAERKKNMAKDEKKPEPIPDPPSLATLIAERTARERESPAARSERVRRLLGGVTT
jgi:hypothetical protein